MLKKSHVTFGEWVIIQSRIPEVKPHMLEEIISLLFEPETFSPINQSYLGDRNWTGPSAPWPSALGWGPCKNCPGSGWPLAAGGGRSHSAPAAPWSCCIQRTGETETGNKTERVMKNCCSFDFHLSWKENFIVINIDWEELGFLTSSCTWETDRLEESQTHREETAVNSSDNVWEDRCFFVQFLWETSHNSRKSDQHTAVCYTTASTSVNSVILKTNLHVFCTLCRGNRSMITNITHWTFSQVEKCYTGYPGGRAGWLTALAQ